MTSVNGLQALELLRERHVPLFSILCDSLRDHTPMNMFDRWDVFEKSLHGHDRTLTKLLKGADQTPR